MFREEAVVVVEGVGRVTTYPGHAKLAGAMTPSASSQHTGTRSGAELLETLLDIGHNDGLGGGRANAIGSSVS